MKGHFFSGPEAHEIILQLEFASDLASLQNLQPSELIGKEVVVRFAGRQPLSSDDTNSPKTEVTGERQTAHARAPAAEQQSASPDDDVLGFSVVSSQVSLRVVGIVDAEAAPAGGGGGFGAYVPMNLAQQLRVRARK